MNRLDLYIINIDRVICGNISKFDYSERDLLCQNLLPQLRNLVEHIALKLYGYSIGQNVQNTWKNIQNSIAYIQTRGELKFLNQFHQLLQISTSHYTLDGENSERLMLKYYEYLIKIKCFLEQKFNLKILDNLGLFPIKRDPSLQIFYEKIVEKIENPTKDRATSKYKDRYYVKKVKPFFVEENIYYEITLTRASDYVSKFDRVIAFTKFEISQNYSIKITLSNEEINVLNKNMPIQIIEKWEISIRPCEFNNFGKIFNNHTKFGNNREVFELMKYMSERHYNLCELVNLPTNEFNNIEFEITGRARAKHFFNILRICRDLVLNKKRGANVISYLLYNFNNKIIKKQYNSNPCAILNGLNLNFKCIPFDDIPFNTSLVEHNPKLKDVFESIDSSDRIHELFARFIKNNTEQKGSLYTSRKEVENFDNIDDLIKSYNESLYSKHTNRHLKTYKNFIYIKEYEDDTYEILKQFKELSKEGFKNYRNSVEAKIYTELAIDCDEKKEALKNLFEHSKVAMIYGAAGTGKSTMINHIANFFDDKDKLFLANTNPAIDNLKRRVKASQCTFQTITKFIYASGKTEFDLLIVDESSTVSNSDMLKVLNKVKFALLVLVGDTFQIESILFGNWFNVAKGFVPKTSIFELTIPYRTTNKNLLLLWGRVRNIDNNILETLTKNGYSSTLNNTIFEREDDDEIILCLNYDGLYGINNINKLLQSSNTNNGFEWGTHLYKVNDPILFNESNRFAPLLYNNLKGRISSIELDKDRIWFNVEIDKVLNEFDTIGYNFELLENADNGNSVIQFSVSPYQDSDNDYEDSESIVPFQVAYAVSIHKAQGLEYKSVKIVITDEVEEMISHNIFYTAITRAREKLKIYWSPETENSILSNLSINSNPRDISLIKSKFKL